MNTRLLFALLLLSATAAWAQKSPEDYLVTTAGDTLRGRIQQVGKHYDKVRLRRAGTPPADFGPAEITSYGSTDGPIAVSRKVGAHGQPQFLVPLVAGTVRLFSGENDHAQRRFYLQPVDSATVVEVLPLTAQLTLARVLVGCPALEFGSDRLRNRYPYTTAGMSALVLAYNQCRQPQQPSTLVKRDNGLRISFGLKAGVNTSGFALSAFPYGGAQTSTTGYQGGVTLNVASHTPFSVQFEAVYIALRSEYEPQGTGANFISTHIHYSQVQVPVLLRYTFGHSKLRPYLNAGPSAGINFGNSSANRYGSPASEINLDLGTAAFGFAGGGGVSVHQPSLPVLSLEVRFDEMIDYNHFVYYTPKHASLRLDFGIAF